MSAQKKGGGGATKRDVEAVDFDEKPVKFADSVLDLDLHDDEPESRSGRVAGRSGLSGHRKVGAPLWPPSQGSLSRLCVPPCPARFTNRLIDDLLSLGPLLWHAKANALIGSSAGPHHFSLGASRHRGPGNIGTGLAEEAELKSQIEC